MKKRQFLDMLERVHGAVDLFLHRLGCRMLEQYEEEKRMQRMSRKALFLRNETLRRENKLYKEELSRLRSGSEHTVEHEPVNPGIK